MRLRIKLLLLLLLLLLPLLGLSFEGQHTVSHMLLMLK